MRLAPPRSLLLATLAATIVAIAFAPDTLAAQVIRGRVLLPDSTPVPGAQVRAVRDARDTVRTLSTANGSYTLTLRGAGTYAITLLRVGHSPTTLSATVAAGETQSLTIVATSSSIELPRVLAARDRSCRARAEGGEVVVRVWEEARKALEASLLAAESGPIVGQWLDHHGTLSPDALVVREQSLSIREHPTTQVFRSVAPTDLLTRGYAAQAKDGIDFFAPDQQVLLSPEFSNSHCFALRDDAGDTLIGVAFEPNDAAAPSRIDITGVAWLDRRSAELRAVDFAYSGPAEAAAAPLRSGRVAFERIADGRWVITSWRARLPAFSVRGGDPSLGSARALRRDTTVREVFEAGGEAVKLTSAGRTLLERRMPRAAVQLVSEPNGLPIAGAIVTVSGTNLQTRSDSLGRVTMTPLPEGRYGARVTFPVFDTLGVEPLSITIRATMDARPDTLRLPRLAALMSRICSDDAGDGVILRGVVRDVNDLPVKNARIMISFLRTDARKAASGTIEYKPEERRTRADDRGAWRMCGVPRATDIVLVTEGNGSFVRDRLKLDPSVGMVATHNVKFAPAMANTLGYDGRQSSSALPADAAVAGRSVIGEFDARHAARTATQSLGPLDLAKRNAVQTWQLLGTLRGVRVVTSSSGIFAVSGRGDLPSMMGDYATACPFVVVLDGVRLSNRSVDGADLTALPPPERLHGVEVYSGGTRLPPIYATLAGGSFCGVIGLWTTRDR